MIKKAAAIYSLVVGVAMILMWVMFYFTGSIPELSTEPLRILLHILAELITAGALIVAGYGLLASRKWANQMYLMSTGALVYTMIQSPGYFLQSGEYGLVAMFAVLLLLALIILASMIRSTYKEIRVDKLL